MINSVKNNSFGESFVSNFDIGDLVYWTEIIYGVNGHENLKHYGTIIDILRIPEGTRFVIMVKIMPFGGKRPMNVLVHQLRKMESED
jgi:hypothetical protein|tara:strand:- start:1234 stop:1494 length:261 start_codon:yes stop_codon:yes gene_type:complete